MSFLMVYITHPDEETAKQISNELIRNKIVACANIFPMASAYWWKGEIMSENEWVSIVKTTKERWLQLEEKVSEIHPYEVPCIVYWEVSANQSYETWIQNEVG